MRYVSVVLVHKNLPSLTYTFDDVELELCPGDVVIVELRKKIFTAVVLELDPELSKELINYKSVISKINFFISDTVIDLIKKASQYYLTEISNFLKLVLPINFNDLKLEYQELTAEGELYNKINLSNMQLKALEEIQNHSNNTILFQGVIASGKTEVFLQYAWQVIQSGYQVLIMVPEIALSQNISQKIINRLGCNPLVWNSSIAKSVKKKLS